MENDLPVVVQWFEREFRWVAEMLWVGIGVIVFAGIVVLIISVIATRAADDLGSVSAHWIAQHRRES